jgi:hypothetical protein
MRLIETDSKLSLLLPIAPFEQNEDITSHANTVRRPILIRDGEDCYLSISFVGVAELVVE